MDAGLSRCRQHEVLGQRAGGRDNQHERDAAAPTPSKAAEEATSEAWNEAVAKARTRRDAQRAETAQAEDAREAAAKEKLARDQAMRTKEVDRENKEHPTVKRGKRGDERSSTTTLMQPIRHATRELQNPQKETKQAAEARTGKEIERSATIEALPPHSSVTAEHRTSETATQRRTQNNGPQRCDQQHGLFGVWHSTNRAKSAGTEKAIRGALNKIRAREAGIGTDSSNSDYERASEMEPISPGVADAVESKCNSGTGDDV